MGSRRRAQSPSSVNKTSHWRLACVFRHAHPAPRCGYKRRARANAQQLFASEPSLANLQSVCKARLTALVLRRVSGGCCPVLHSSAITLLPPLGASALLKEIISEQSKRAPRATGVFLKMASRSCVSGCGRFLTSSDGHDRCPSCLGFRHPEATVRASPSSTSPRASHSSSTSHRLGFPDEYAGSSDRAGPSISFGAPAVDGISITASGDELGSEEDDSAALPPSGRVALPESDPELTAMLSPGRWEHRAAL